MRTVVVGLTVLVALLAGCGGGGSGTSAAPGPVAPQATDLPVKVVDGAIQGARVCLDRNRNDDCEPDEPAGTTDADGRVVLHVATADIGNFPVIAVMPAEAVDAENGTVITPFLLRAPSERSTIVSPFTSLVTTVMENTGDSADAAEAFVRSQLRADASLFDDFSVAGTAEAARLKTLARLLVLTAQEHIQVIGPALGQAAMDGTPITMGDLHRLVQDSVLGALPIILQKEVDPRLTAATADTRAGVLRTLAIEADSYVQQVDPATGRASGYFYLADDSTHTDILPTNVALYASGGKLIAGARLPDTSTGPGVLQALLHSAQVVNGQFLDTYAGTALTASAAQATPDATGHVRFVQRHLGPTDLAPTGWLESSDPSEFHWNGSAWMACPAGFESTATVPDAEGRSRYDLCDKSEQGVRRRRWVDISGQSIGDVGTDLQYVSTRNFSFYRYVGNFPAGSRLLVEANTVEAAAPRFQQANAQLDALPQVAAGDPTACSAINIGGHPPGDSAQTRRLVTPVGDYTVPADGLDSFIASRQGTPCVRPEDFMFFVNRVIVRLGSGPRNEWWGQSTAALGVLPEPQPYDYQAPQPPDSYYTGRTLLQVAFAPGGVARYFACQEDGYGFTPRNCDPIGTGTYTITTMGDARVLSFAGGPPQVAALPDRTIYVERGGQVYAGSIPGPSTRYMVQMNLTAANAVLAPPGYNSGSRTPPPIDPEAGP